MLEQFTDEVEADLLRYYRIDLLDLWRGGLSLRRVGVLIAGLPPDSLTMSALAPHIPEGAESDRPDRQWSTEAHLLASVVDSVTMLTHVYVSAHSKGKGGKWEPMRRPGEGRKAIRRMTDSQRAALAAHKRRQRGN